MNARRKIPSGKRGTGLGTIITIFLAIVILILLVSLAIQWLKTSKNATDTLVNPSLAKENAVYRVNYLGVAAQTLSSGDCSRAGNAGNTYTCKAGAKVQFYVNMNNYLKDRNNLYARAIIGKNCDSKYTYDSCTTKDILEGEPACGISAQSSSDCPVNAPYQFTRGTYVVYAGGRCTGDQCVDTKTYTYSNAGLLAYNVDNYILITVP